MSCSIGGFMKESISCLALAITTLLFFGCGIQSNIQSNIRIHNSYRSLGVPIESKVPTCDVEIFRTHPPSKNYTRVSRIDIHLEAPGSQKLGFAEALPELRKQACESGADAVIDFRERSSNLVGEGHAYHVTAMGIRY